MVINKWAAASVPLEKVYFNACHNLRHPSAVALVKHCGARLRKLALTGAIGLDSSVLRTIAQYSARLEELTLTHIEIRQGDLRMLVQTVWATICWIDFSSCTGLTTFPGCTTLPMLQVLLLDQTRIQDDGLRAIARTAPHLKYLSLRDCRYLSDIGAKCLAASDGCTNLEILDLKGTRISDEAVVVVETGCPVSFCCVGIFKTTRGSRSGGKLRKVIDEDQSNSESGSDSDYEGG
ncbi:hypothetical protein PINS_up000114 [Pythium insidiosum]|nr:hypothetical protein PINS_up000114 [Pythium insidiosum]